MRACIKIEYYIPAKYINFVKDNNVQVALVALKQLKIMRGAVRVRVLEYIYIE